jgi:class 3 adenylate cyclase/tetratricopeptide (TPR) repeat protein
MVSVLFLDLVGFTSLSESRDAEDVRALLSRYFETSRTIVGRHAGTIAKFIGDAVMAVWGAPIAREDDAERAVRAALELVAAVTAFGQEVGAPHLRARAGVVTGRAAAMDTTLEGTVVGDRVNTASRIQSIAEPGTVCVDAVTYGVTSAAIAYADAGLHTVKGKTEPLQLWRAERVVGGRRGTQRQEGFEGALVGRDSDLRMLKELLHATGDRRAARLVAVTGPAGVGKTRLGWELLNYVDGLAERFLWHQGRCLSYGDGVAYWAIAEMVRQRLGIPQEESTEDVAAKLAAGLERWIPSAADREFLHSRLGALLGLSDPGLGQEELFAGWRLFFERLAEQSPVVLVFEDLQWADDGVLTFIEHMLDWSGQHPIYIVTLARPEIAARPDGWPATRHGTTLLQLEPLADEPLHELLDGLVRGLPADARSRIVSRAEGIPLYALETLRALADRGVLVPDAGGAWVVGGAVEDLDVPASLSSLLAARLDALTADEHELVRAMAVFGGNFTRDTAAALADVPEDRIDAGLGALVRKQVLTIRADPLSPNRGQYAFAQQLLRTVAYEMLSRAELKPRHLRAAEHLRLVFPQDGEEVAEVIAAHYLDAYRAAPGDPDADELRREALQASRRAARRAATVGAPAMAERAYRTALELVGDDEPQRIALLEAAGVAASSAGHYEAALELLEAATSAHAQAGRLRDAARVAAPVAEALRLVGRNEEAIERLRAALATVGADDLDADVARMNYELGGAYLFVGRADEARESLERALAASEALELWDVLCRALNVEAVRLDFASRHEQARGLYRAAIAIRARTNRSSQREQGNLAEGLVALDDPEAVAACEAALAEARRAGFARFECMAAGNLLEAWLLSGRWERMHEFAAEVLGSYSADSPDAGLVWPRLAVLHAFQGDLAAARAQLELAAPHLAHSDDIDDRGLYSGAAVVVDVAEGRLAAGLEGARAVIDAGLDALGAHHVSVRQAWPEAVRAALALGRRDVAAELVGLMAERPPGRIPPLLKAELRRAQGLLAAAGGEEDGVEGALTAAIDAHDALGYPFWAGRARTDLAAWLLERGRGVEAWPLLEIATTAFTNLGAAPELARARELAAAGLSGETSSALS